MRLYEIAKQLGVSNKEVLEALKKEGLEAKSHMSALDDKALAFVKKRFGKKNKPKKEPISKPDPVRESKKTMQKQPIKRSSKPTRRSSGRKRPEKKQFRPAPEPELIVPEEIVLEAMTPAVAATRMGKPVTEIIGTLLRWGIVSPINQTIPLAAIRRLAEHYEIKTVQSVAVAEEKVEKKLEAGAGTLQSRPPVVVILGHVDHGKTTLLDFVRKTRVASREKGGITQHIGAYEATTPQGSIVFLDTPGHAAFPKIRQRGVRVADIAILIVAADDGVMPQTIEAIKHVKQMGVPVIAAINKVDRVDEARIEAIKQQLSQHDMLSEDWGGDVIIAPISAKTGQGVDHLLEMIILQAQLMELRASHDGGAKGYVLEAELERGRGAVATVISQHGLAKIGNYFTCGNTVGRINSMVDSHGQRVKEVGPAFPVRIAGFESVPEAGDFFQIVSKEDYLKARAAISRIAPTARESAKEGALSIIVKTDTHSSQEALVTAIEKISKKADRPYHILHAGVGNISESDVELAYNTGGIIISLHVKPEANAASLAQHRGVSIETFDIIYKLLETLEERAKQEKVAEIVQTKIGSATVLRVFDVKRLGVIAGVYINDGRFVRNGYVKAFRGGQLIGEGKITSLQREKKTVKEAHTGFECGFIVDGFADWQVDDTAECYLDLPKK